MKTVLKNLKNTLLTIIHVPGHFRPISATYYINKNKKKSRKIIKNTIFQTSIFCNIVAENIIFGRKLAIWAPESTQKPYIDLPT